MCALIDSILILILLADTCAQLRPGTTVIQLFEILLHAPWNLVGGECVSPRLASPPQPPQPPSAAASVQQERGGSGATWGEVGLRRATTPARGEGKGPAWAFAQYDGNTRRFRGKEHDMIFITIAK